MMPAHGALLSLSRGPVDPEKGGGDVTPRIAIALTTVGRPAITRLLQSCAESSLPPVMVAIADQSGGHLPPLCTRDYPFDVRIVTSSGGASAGRNLAAQLVG